jgi:uncharacterized membrane protein YtjA (UPF0391 family)
MKMRWLSGLFLIVAILAAVLWLTMSVAAGIAKIIMAVFFVLLLVFSFLRQGRRGRP